MDSDLRFMYFTDVSTTVAKSLRLFVREGLSDCGDPGWFFSEAIPRESTEDEQEFLREKRFFETLPRWQLRPYEDQYVAVHGQAVVDSDRNLHALTDRFFSKFGPDASVFISFVGSRPKHILASPMIL